MRKLEIENMVELFLKKLTAEGIGYIGVLLWSVVKENNDELSDKEIRKIQKMSQNQKNTELPIQVKRFLLSISNNPEEVRYFVSIMQNSIIKELEENDRITTEEIEELRNFFTIDYLKECCRCLDKKKQNINVLITAVVLDSIIQFEKYKGISGKICDLITELPLESIVHMGDAMCEAYSIIYEYDF